MTFVSAGKKDRSAEYLIGIVTLILVFIMASRTPIDSDLWWHLRAGQQTWESGHIVTTDMFSYTRNGIPWTNHSWLAQIILYLLFKWGGYLGIGALVATLATLSMALVYFQMEGPTILRPFILVGAAVIAAWVWSPRPQLFSLVFLALVGYLIYLYKYKGQNRLWLLIPIFIFWSNLHGGYVLGFIFLGTMILGELLNHLLRTSSAEKIPFKKVVQLIMWTCMSAFAVLINPNGINIWLIPFQTVEITNLQMYISEWTSPDFHNIGQQVLLWLIYGGMAAMIFSGRSVDIADLLVFLVFASMSTIARRNFGPFAIISPPIIMRYLWPSLINLWGQLRPRVNHIINRVQKERQRTGNQTLFAPSIKRAINLGIIALLGGIAMVKLYAVTNPSFMNFAIEAQYPTSAITWIQDNHPAGQLFSSYDWGGFLIWNLRDYPVFIDGRTDLYKDEMINQWFDVVNASGNWQKILDTWKVNLLLLEPQRPVVQLLAINGWKLLYADQKAVVYGR